MIEGKNTVTFWTTEKNFYKYTDRRKIAKDFPDYLLQATETFGYSKTNRSKILHQKNTKRAIWDIHPPNPGIRGKNAFRMLCIIDKNKKEILLAYLFHRENLKFKGSKNTQQTKQWHACIKEIKENY